MAKRPGSKPAGSKAKKTPARSVEQLMHTELATRARAVTQPAAARSAAPGSQPLRFAHPFFTTTPVAERAQVPGVGTSMLDHIQGNLQPIPPPSREPTFRLEEIIGKPGADAIAATGKLRFHTLGDSGRSADSPQGAVATAMQQDYDIAHPETCPAFFFHLGDVIYGPNKVQDYRVEFYEPYVHYPGKIVAIAGNHDGEVFPATDPVTLEAFRQNFCAPAQTVPAIAGTIYRETMNQPGAYYLLEAPFVQIVALYSNAAENPGFLSGAIPGQAQHDWLLATLKAIAAERRQGAPRRALVFATHHPPFTAGGHSPSTEMLAEIDAVCAEAGILPDVFLSGHAHSYQRYTRRASDGRESAYVVVGTGGIGAQAVAAATGQVTGDHTYVTSYKGYGYLLVEVSANAFNATFYGVDPVTQVRSAIESFTVDFVAGRVS